MSLGGSVSPWRSGVEGGRSPLGHFRKPGPCFPWTYATGDAKKDENGFASMKFRLAAAPRAYWLAAWSQGPIEAHCGWKKRREWMVQDLPWPPERQTRISSLRTAGRGGAGGGISARASHESKVTRHRRICRRSRVFPILRNPTIGEQTGTAVFTHCHEFQNTAIARRTRVRWQSASPRFSPPAGCSAEPLSGSPVAAQVKRDSSKSVNCAVA